MQKNICKRIYVEYREVQTNKQVKLSNKSSSLTITQMQVHLIYDDLEKYLIG